MPQTPAQESAGSPAGEAGCEAGKVA